MITETENTLEITEEQSSLQVLSQESSLDVSQTIQELTIQQVGNELVVDETSQELVISEEGISALEITPDAMVVNNTFVGAGVVLNFTAGEALGGHRAVVVQNDEAFYADATTLPHAGQVVGVTTHAASSGQSIEVQYAGEMEEPSWAFSPGAVYIGPTGTLAQTRPTTGWVMNIGIATAPTKLSINRTIAIARS